MPHSSALRVENPLSKIRAFEPNSVIQLVCCLVNDTRWSLNFKIRNPRCISGRVSTLEIFFCSARVVLVWLSVPPCPFLLYRSSTEFHPQMGAIVIYILLGCICFYVVAIYSNWDIRQIKFTRISLDCYRLYIRLIMTLFKIENLHFVIQINIYGYFSCIWKMPFNIIAFGKQYAKQFYKQYECHQRSML